MNLPFKMIQETDLEKRRAETFWTKEPETIEWIKSWSNKGTFFDVGANIGVYSLYAASLYPRLAVFAFEPHDANFKRLRENISLNNFHVKVCAFRLAVGDKIKWDGKFFINDAMAGSSGGQIGQAVDEHGQSFEPIWESPTPVCDLNHLQTWAQPHYIKIDVDGQEEAIVDGMQGVLDSEELQSVLIEVNEQSDMQYIKNVFWIKGFTHHNRFNFLDNHSTHRRAKEGNTARNLIFTRRPRDVVSKMPQETHL